MPMGSEPVSGSSKPEQAVFSFVSVGVVRFLFEEVQPEAPEEGKQPVDYANDSKLDLNAEIRLLVSNQAELELTFRLAPSPRWRPYKIDLKIVGRFSSIGATNEQLVQFCQTNAPAIIFPYARQAINEITSNARFGPVRLPLMNLQSFLVGGDWRKEPTGSTTTKTANAPEQPSEQSPSASPD